MTVAPDSWVARGIALRAYDLALEKKSYHWRMHTLTARFDLQAPASLLLEVPDNDVPEVAVQRDKFAVVVRLRPDRGWSFKRTADQNTTRRIELLEVVVSRAEDEAVPAVVESGGIRDLTVRDAYLRHRSSAYQDAALAVANDVLDYFRYELRTPAIRPIERWLPELRNPTWFNELGEELRTGGTAVSQPVPGLHGQLGARRLTTACVSDLKSFLQAPHGPTLAESLLSDAQTAWFEGSLRRTVLELAICSEVIVKRAFFSHTSPAGAAFDYLEDKAKISVRVLELLDGVAKEAFGHSFRNDDAASYRHIDYLFRCRNKIAHRGELTFRDDTGVVQSADAATVEAWWHAVDSLGIWLKTRCAT